MVIVIPRRFPSGNASMTGHANRMKKMTRPMECMGWLHHNNRRSCTTFDSVTVVVVIGTVGCSHDAYHDTNTHVENTVSMASHM